jgi:ribosomal protein S18 acetylase RimI-like enzyme
MRRDYAEEPGLLRQVYDLLAVVWPDLPGRAEGARGWGMRWETSTPFLRGGDGRFHAHVGVLELRLVLAGRETRVGGIHAVATHPDFRGRGYCRELLAEALRWCDERYETVLLSTERPAIYEGSGFRVVPEHRFAGRAGGGGGRGLRPLDRASASDGALLLRLLDARAPVSNRLGIVRDRAIFLFDTATWPLHYAEELDAVIAYSVREGTLRLHDVVAARMPTLDRVLSLVPERFDRLEVYFTPDLLGADLAPEPFVAHGDYLMVRGPWPVEGEPHMLPIPARC